MIDDSMSFSAWSKRELFSTPNTFLLVMIFSEFL